MIVTYGWLADYVDLTGHTPAEVADILTMLGLTVEEMETLPSGDTRYGLEVTYNRADLLGVVGVAREVAAATDQPLKQPPFEVEPVGEPASIPVRIEAEDLCPRYSALVIEGVKVGPSPDWLARRLESVGIAPVNNVVDVTNFVCWELGQPLHAFDLVRLAGPEIVVRRARAGETMETIQHQRVDLTPETLVIADRDHPVAIAGVIGGAETEIGAGTTRLLLESAYFSRTGIRRTARRLGVRSASSHRFEHGVDWNGIPRASLRAASLILQVAGGRVASDLIDVDRLNHERVMVELRFDRLHQIAGLEIPREGTVEALKRLGFLLVDEGSLSVRLAVPSWRQGDVTREIDVIEEVLRLYGYENIPLSPSLGAGRSPKAKRAVVEDRVREILVGAGYHECLTFSFQAPDDRVDPTLWTDRPALVVKNPVRTETPCMRRSLLGGLLDAKRTNRLRGREQVRLFEASTIYLAREGTDDIDEKSTVALLADADLREVRGAVERLLESLGVLARIEAAPFDHPFFRPKHAARLLLGAETLGFIGVLGRGPREAASLDDAAPAVCELDLDLLTRHATIRKTYREPSSYPAVERHIAIVLAEDVSWQTIRKTVLDAQTAGPLLESLEFLDLFTSAKLGAGKKSVAFGVTFRSPERTLEAPEVDAFEAAIVKALESSLGAVRRA